MKNHVRALLTALVLVVAPAVAGAQSIAYNSGQNIAPGYEGWEEDADGSKYFLFGYMNRNWEEELDVPVGADNGFSPGSADQGQPTHFLPRRNRFVFRVKVPANFSSKDELVWTLTTNGVTEKAFASLREDYKVDDVVKASETGALGAGSSSPEIRSNKPPVVKVEGNKTIIINSQQTNTIKNEIRPDRSSTVQDWQVDESFTDGNARIGIRVAQIDTANQRAVVEFTRALPLVVVKPDLNWRDILKRYQQPLPRIKGPIPSRGPRTKR